MTPHYLAQSLLALLFFLWTPTLALAYSLSTTHHRIDVDPVLAVFSCVLATMAGATTLAIRLNGLTNEEPPRPLVKPWLFCFAHMMGSWLAGTVAFLLGRSQAMEVWASLLVVVLLSFGGAKVVEQMAEKYLAGSRPPQPKGTPT